MRLSRREMLRYTAVATGAAAVHRRSWGLGREVLATPLSEVRYEQVVVLGALQAAQRENARSILMAINPDSLVKPFREMAGQPAPGASLGGWYEWKPDFDFHHDDAGFAPAHCYGQWMSALARLAASAKAGGAAGDPAMEARVLQLDEMLAATISPAYFDKTRFPCYSFDKLVCGLMDAHRLLGDGRAFKTMDAVLVAAESWLPGHSIEREMQWKMGADQSWMWDESYTMSENLFLVSAMGADAKYRAMARAYLDDRALFEPLARNVNALSDQHAYSYTNALCSAMQAYLTEGSLMHLDAARNGFAMIEAQSFVTGGWGPDELLRKPGYDDVANSLTNTHNSFETPCGSYAHMKLTRYLLRATRDGHYGDSMERVFFNTVLGALPLQSDGKTFYYADYNFAAKRIYSVHRWPCCAGTLPQVVADYGVNGYFQEPGAIWVNLYQPSALHWTTSESAGEMAVQLEQSTNYPESGAIHFRVSVAKSVNFALRLRIPGWAGQGTSIKVNGRQVPVVVERGFTRVERTWRDGDTVDLELPMRLRIEAMPSNGGVMQLGTLALLYGPWVLFAIREPTDAGPIAIDSDALLQATRTGPKAWSVRLPNGTTREMVPFTEIGVRDYSTYVKAIERV